LRLLLLPLLRLLLPLTRGVGCRRARCLGGGSAAFFRGTIVVGLETVLQAERLRT